MESRAKRMRANAVVGVDIDYEVLGQGGNMLMVTASGTAVVSRIRNLRYPLFNKGYLCLYSIIMVNRWRIIWILE